MLNPVLPGDAIHVLSEDQKDWFRKRFGVEYVAVATNADVPSRRQRRANGDRGYNFGLGRMDVPGSKR